MMERAKELTAEIILGTQSGSTELRWNNENLDPEGNAILDFMLLHPWQAGDEPSRFRAICHFFGPNCTISIFYALGKRMHQINAIISEKDGMREFAFHEPSKMKVMQGSYPISTL